MTVLATALSRSMRTSAHDLVVFDREGETWTPHPWPQVHARAESIAARILDEDEPGAVGLVGEPTADFVAAVQGAWLAGQSVAILPGRSAAPTRSAGRKRRWPGSPESVCAWCSATAMNATCSPRGRAAAGDRYGAAARRNVRRVSRRLTALPAWLRCCRAPRELPEPHAPCSCRPRRCSVTSTVCSPLRCRSRGRCRLHVATAVPRHGSDVPAQRRTVRGPFWLAPTAAFTASPFRWLRWLSESGATLTAAPNMAYSMIGKYARLVSDVDLGRVRVTISGGEPVDCAAMERFATALSGFGFDARAMSPSYGLAESTCAVTIPGPGTGVLYDEVRAPATDSDATVKQRHAILGTPIPGMEVRIGPAPERSAEVLDREVGEVEIRGTSMMSGYVGDAPLNPTRGSLPAIWATSPTTAWSCAGGPKRSSPSRAATCFRPRSNAWPPRYAACARARWSRWARRRRNTTWSGDHRRIPRPR